MEMINKRVLDDLRTAGMASPQAEVVAAHIPDWSQFVTKADLEDLRAATSQEAKDLRRELKNSRHWMIAGFAVLSLLSD